MSILRNFPVSSADNIYGRGIRDGGSMKLRYLVVVLIMALVVVGSVSRTFHRTHNANVVAEESSSTDDGEDDSDYTEFA